MNSRTERFSSIRMLANGSAWNGFGRVFSLLIALIATPLLLHQLGIERWGLFALILAICSTFGILDLGISAALTRALAERIGTPDERKAGRLVVMAFVLLTISGVLGGAAAYSLTPLGVDHMLNVPAYLRGETIAAFHVLAAGIPLIVLNAGMWGVLAAYQRFGLANVINLPISILYYVGPLIALEFHADLVGVTISLVAVRGAQCLVYLALICRTLPELDWSFEFDASLLRGLLSISAWMTLSNTLASLIMQVDRLIVAARLTLTETSYYSAPLDLVLRLIVVPIAIATAFFPAVATSYRTMPARSGALLRIGSLAVTAIVWPVCVLLVAFPHELLALWLGREIAGASQYVLLILGLGTYVACMSVLPSTFTDAIGRPDIGAKIMLVQALIFPGAIIVMIGWLGIEGAAVAWTVRCIISLAVRLWVCRKLCPQLAPVIRSLGWVSLIGTIALAGYPFIGSIPLRVMAIAATAPAVMLLSVIALTTTAEVQQVTMLVQRWFVRSASVRASDRM
jgi:O-antigen/teichoic acid export membrane protein